MQWSALVCLIIVIVCGVTVKSVLAFTFCAIASFILARNLLGSDVELDFTRVFIYKDQSPNKLRNASSVINKPFPQALAECRETAIKNILRDFVVSWFQNVGVEERFVVETRMLLEEATESLYEEVVRTDVSTFVEKLCIVLHKHLAAYRVTKLSLAKNHEKFKFNAVKFSEVYQSLEEKPRVHSNNELQYLRTVADLLLHRLVKKSALDCDTGRFILREILAINLFLPLVDSLSDPDFLNVSIINVFGDEGQEFQNTTQSESNNISERITEPSLMLMECPREKTSDCDPYSNSGFTGDSFDTELSTECKLQNMAVINPNHEEFIEVSTEQSGNSKKTGNIEPTKSSKQDCASNYFEVKSKTNSQAPVESNERYDAFNRESTNSSSLTRNINTATVRDELKNENGKTPEGKENGLKLKTLRGFKIHPNGFKFSRNLKHFNKSPAVKQSVLGKMSQSISETFSSKGSPKVNQDQGDQPTLDDTMNNLDLADTNLPLQGNEEVNQTGMHENPATNEDIQDPVHSELDMCKINSSSSFEEVEVGNIIDCNKDNVTVTEPESKENDNDGTLTCMTTSNQTNGTSKQRQKIVSESSNEDENFVARRINCSLEKEVSGSSSSSTEESDTDVFEHVQDNRFVAEDGDTSDVETGKEVFSATGESDIHVAQKPCLMISIPSTELVKDHTWEPGKRKYTVYHIVYDIQLWPQLENHELAGQKSSLKAEECSDTTQRSINRRYREFMELHHRLSSGVCANYMKDIPKPNRKFGSPFFRLDQDVVEGRQILLENYLKCLVNKPVILNCDVFKGFLGIGHLSHTKFCRQIAVPVPRINKMLQKNVNKFIDHIKTIKTVLESGPIDGDKEEEYEDIRRVLGEEKTSQDEIRTFAICSGGCKLTHSYCYSGKCFQAYIQQKQQDSDIESLVAGQRRDELQAEEFQCIRLNEKYSAGPILKQLEKSTKNHALEAKNPRRKRSLGSKPADDCNSKTRCFQEDHTTYRLTESVLNLSCQLLQDQKSWVCLEPVQKAAITFFGGVIEWWLNSRVSELVTMEQWHYYLNLLTETIWPGGQLMSLRKLGKTEEEKEKNMAKAVETLSNSFGGVIHAGIGTDAIMASASEIVESLQYKEINRQLLLEVLEVTLTEVFPDIVNDQESYINARRC